MGHAWYFPGLASIVKDEQDFLSLISKENLNSDNRLGLLRLRRSRWGLSERRNDQREQGYYDTREKGRGTRGRQQATQPMAKRSF